MKATARVFLALAIAATLFVVTHPSAVRGSNPTIVCGATNPCITTHGYDDSRSNVNSAEAVFQADNFNFPGSVHLDSVNNLQGIVFAQPLYLAGVQAHPNADIVYVATEENVVYALFGASLSTTPLWSTALNQGTETAIPDNQLPGGGCGDISPEMGITGTPVIDKDSASAYPGVLYAVSSHYKVVNGTAVFSQRLNALSVFDGTQAYSIPPLDIATAYGGISNFQAEYQNQRAALALAHDLAGNPLIFVAWGGHCDHTPYTGKLGVFTVTTNSTTCSAQGQTSPCMIPVATFDAAGSSGGTSAQSGIWMGGSGPVIDDTTSYTNSISLYLSTGNGAVSSPYLNNMIAGSSLGQSVLQFMLSASQSGGPYILSPVGAYTANEYNILNCGSWANDAGFPCPTNRGLSCQHLLALPPPYASGSTYCSPGDMDLDAGGDILATPTGNILSQNDPSVVLSAGKEAFSTSSIRIIWGIKKPDTSAPCTSTQTIQCFGGVRLTPWAGGGPQPDTVGSRCGPAFWAGSQSSQENILYLAGSADTTLWAYNMITGGSFATNPVLGSYTFKNSNGVPVPLPYPGTCPIITWDAAGTSNPAGKAVLWLMSTGGYQTKINGVNQGATPVVVYAFPAVPANGAIGNPLWMDNTNGPGATKFSEPTIVNGHVYAAGESITNNNDYNTPGLCLLQTGTCYGAVVAWY